MGQAPDGLVTVIKVQLKLVGQFPAAGQDPAILLGVQRAEAFGEDLVGGQPEQVGTVLEAAAPGQGLVDEGIAGLAVLDEKHHVRQGVEQGRDGGQAVEQGRQVAGLEGVE
ncbi:hypothetical protein D3C78_994950 [compost metagenome]